jgi:hypothetical protein
MNVDQVCLILDRIRTTMCHGKRRYKTLDKALDRAAFLTGKSDDYHAKHKNGRQAVSYYCVFCNSFHAGYQGNMKTQKSLARWLTLENLLVYDFMDREETRQEIGEGSKAQSASKKKRSAARQKKYLRENRRCADMKDDERALCHGRPRGAAGHEPGGGGEYLEDACRYCQRSITNVLGVWMLSKGERELPEQPKGKMMYIDAAGKVTNCDRCGDPCRVADRRNLESKPFRLSEKPKGVCANCVMTQFLYSAYPVNLQIDEAGPELLLRPGIREAFLSCGLLEGCDLNINEVNWTRVVANWNLPVAIIKSGRNPYRMGDSPRSHLRPKSVEVEPDEKTQRLQQLVAETNGVLQGEAGREFMELSGLRALLDQAKGPIQ